MSINLVVEGNVANEPVLRHIPSGDAVCNIRVMSTRRKRDASGEWVDGATTVFDVACWGALASNVSEGIKKGDPVVVTGNNLEVRRSGDSGEYVNLQVSASTVAVSAKWSPASSNRQPKPHVADSDSAWDTDPAMAGAVTA